jgi:tRNA(His) 5'-end guanylyltransferase
MRRTPVIMRLDGKAFHTYTRHELYNDEGAFSNRLKEIFANSVFSLIQEIQGAAFAYLQSDEVSILITDWKKLTTHAWFNYNTQKITSVAASMFTYFFNEEARMRGIESPAFFDARAFNLPFEEVTNYFIWRQQDATRNSIQMLGREYFSHKELNGKNVSNIQDMLMNVHGVNWNDIPTWHKRGFAIKSFLHEDRRTFGIDPEIPVFTKNRGYIEKHLVFED